MCFSCSLHTIHDFSGGHSIVQYHGRRALTFLHARTRVFSIVTTLQMHRKTKVRKTRNKNVRLQQPEQQRQDNSNINEAIKREKKNTKHYCALRVFHFFFIVCRGTVRNLCHRISEKRHTFCYIQIKEYVKYKQVLLVGIITGTEVCHMHGDNWQQQKIVRKYHVLCAHTKPVHWRSLNLPLLFFLACVLQLTGSECCSLAVEMAS